MEIKQLRNHLLSRAKEIGACPDGITELSQASTKEDIAKCFIEFVDFCLVHNYPDNEFLKFHLRQELEDIGIYIDKTITINNERRIIFLGECYGTVIADTYSVSMIRVKHNSRINIRACGYARIMVDALDNADIIIDISEDAVVIVNLYGNATCQGATKVIRKGTTYEI